MKEYIMIYHKCKPLGYLENVEIKKLIDRNTNEVDEVINLGKSKHLNGVNIIGIKNSHTVKTIKIDKVYTFKTAESLNGLFNILSLSDNYLAVRMD